MACAIALRHRPLRGFCMLRSCTYCNSESAKPPNPRYQVQPGKEGY